MPRKETKPDKIFYSTKKRTQVPPPPAQFFLLLLILAIISSNAFSQARIVFNTDPYLVLNGGTGATPAYLVIDNAAANAITFAAPQTTGGIISESEFNQVKWNIGINTGIYTVPFTKAFGGPILPVTTNITVAGAGAGNIKFATYGGAAWDNDTYRPSDVTDMGTPNNSAYVIDRFWIADANGYTTKPTPTITFQYADGEWSAAGNTITEANLFAQRFNPAPANLWSDWLGPFGTTNTVANTVSSGSVNPGDFFRSWTLVDQASPLPIELLSFEGKCSTPTNRFGRVVLNWSTASEINNDYFEIERNNATTTGGHPQGENMEGWNVVGKIKGAGNSTTTRSYEFTDLLPSPYSELPTLYYRLKQTDFDGKFSYFNPIAVEMNCVSTFSIFPNPAGNALSFYLFSEEDDEIIIEVCNMLGQTILKKSNLVAKGNNSFTFDIASVPCGMYLLKAKTSAALLTANQKIIKQ